VKFLDDENWYLHVVTNIRKIWKIFEWCD